MVPRSAEIVIIGAGAVGCSIAYHLARAGQRDVLVLERDAIGAGSTSKAAGGVRAQFGTELEIRFSLEGIAFLQRFEEEMGAQCGYVQDGYLLIVTDQKVLERSRRNVELQNRMGVPSRIISPEEAREIAPPLAIGDVLAGVWCPIDGHAAPNDVCSAYARRARELGATILEDTAVTALERTAQHTTRVGTAQGTVEAGTVVNAAGANARWIARMLGLDAPVAPMRRHIFVTDTIPELARPTPLVIDTGSGFYARGEHGGLLFSPGDAVEMPDASEPAVDWSVLEGAVDKGVRRFPILERAAVRSAWAGLRPLTPDEHAIVDWLPGVDGVFCAIGFGGHGFQHSPATGRFVSEWLTQGKSSVDLSPLSFARFETLTQTVKASALSGLA
ncbi:MAG: FAD-dependent oxidoreductase [Chloroflexota bacterium]